MLRYGKNDQQLVKRAMHKMKKGELKSGRSGKLVKSKSQAVAIGLSEARKKGQKFHPSLELDMIRNIKEFIRRIDETAQKTVWKISSRKFC